MKKLILSAILLINILNLSAQTADTDTLENDNLPINACRTGHYLTFDVGGGLHNVSYKTGDFGDKKLGGGFSIGAGYRYFFTQNWGVGIAVDFNTFAAKSKLNYIQSEENGSDDKILSEHKERNYRTYIEDLEEKVKVSVLDFPIGLYYQYSFGQKWRLGAGANFIITTITSKKFKNNSGTIRVTSELPYYNVVLEDLPAHNLESFTNFEGTPDFKSISYGLGLECKLYYAITKQLDLSMGISGAYRLSNLQKQNLENLFDEETLKYYGVTQTQICDGVKPANLTVSVGIRYRLQRKPKSKPIVEETPIVVQPVDTVIVAQVDTTNTDEINRNNQTYEQDLMPTDYRFVNNAFDMLKQLKLKRVGDPVGSPILFDTNSDKIKSTSNTIMDTVVVFMKENPDVTKLEVSAHTDNVGSDAYNLNLSKRRAQSVVNYLINHGIEAKRLKPVGYGESKPLNNNATPQQREINRRVEFMILELQE